ncbi:MAG: hypothetical protein ACSLFB_09785, partial [Acidimicrobiales bacterium]
MSRDIGKDRTCKGFGPWSFLAGLVAAGGVECEAAEEFSGSRRDDSDVEVGDEQHDGGAGVGASDADVVHLSSASEGHGPGFVDASRRIRWWVLEVPGDGLGASVKTTGNELLAQVRDQFDGVVRHAYRRVVGPASSGFERGVDFRCGIGPTGARRMIPTRCRAGLSRPVTGPRSSLTESPLAVSTSGHTARTDLPMSRLIPCRCPEPSH